jgi:D-glycero-D-manno-heptose 1,7-bisphosphate phosphatase
VGIDALTAAVFLDRDGVVNQAMHARLSNELPIDEFPVCYDDDRDECACRKPRPGLLTQPPAYDLARSLMIADRWRDIEAGRRAGVRTTMLIDYGYDEPITTAPGVRVRSLAEAAQWLEDQGLTGHP